MNQCSAIGLGNDISVMAGYAQAANDRLGNVDFIFENTGSNTATIRMMYWDGTSSPSGYSPIATSTQEANQMVGGFTVVAGGVKTQSYVLLNKRVAFFGSGNTMVNITPVIRNKAALRGDQIDILQVGRKGWKYDDGFNKPTLTKKWGQIDTGTGEVSPSTGAGQGGSNAYDNGKTIV